MKIRYISSHFVPYKAQLDTNALGTSSLKITSGENLQTSEMKTRYESAFRQVY